MKFEYNLAAPDRYNLLKAFAIENKKHATEAESLLWHHISRHQLEVKFNRQYVIADYIVDFVCLEKGLVIEVDGAYHSEYEQMLYDENRSKVLEEMGFKVVRYTNEEVLFETEKTINAIKQLINNL